MISSSNLLLSWATAVLCWLCNEYSSWYSLEILYFSATKSAVSIIGMYALSASFTTFGSGANLNSAV